MRSPAATVDDPGGVRGPRGRIAATFSGSRELARLAYRDPEHLSERITLYAMQRLGEPSWTWADAVRRARPDVPVRTLADELRKQSAELARVDGAIAGTPFYLAVVPGYLGYLWQEGRMGLRTAALYDHDPRELRTAAEMLALRGVHSTVEAAEASLVAVRDRPLPDKPEARRPLRTWIRSVQMILVFGGFLAAPTSQHPEGIRGWLRAAAELLLGAVIWAITWVLPVTFMIAMAWACESHARQLGLRALALYDGEAATSKEAIADARRHRDRGHDRRQVVRVAALALSVAIPIGFVAYVNHVRQTVGVNWLGALGALVAVAVVIATAVIGSRR